MLVGWLAKAASAVGGQVTLAQLDEAARNFGLEAGFGTQLQPRALAAFERQLQQHPNAPALYTVLASMLGPARYTPEALPHFGLAAPLLVRQMRRALRQDLALLKAILEGTEGV